MSTRMKLERVCEGEGFSLNWLLELVKNVIEMKMLTNMLSFLISH